MALLRVLTKSLSAGTACTWRMEIEMEHDEGMGAFGWFALALVLLQVILALLFGFAATFWLSLPLAFVVLVVLVILCGGKTPRFG